MIQKEVHDDRSGNNSGSGKSHKSGSERFDEEAVLRVADTLQNCRGKVVLAGCGTSGQAAKKIAHTLCCIEIPAIYMCPADAVHGELGLLQEGDVLILISKGGSTEELLPFIPACRAKKALLIGVTDNAGSEIGRNADILHSAKIDREPDPFNMLATASTLAVIALFDGICVSLAQRRGFTKDQFAIIHPHGAVGNRLLNHLA